MTINDIRKAGAVPAGGWLQRPVFDTRALEETVSGILTEIRDGGDRAVRKYSLQFDKSAPVVPELSIAEIKAGAAAVDEELKAAIRMAAANISVFHLAQRRPEEPVETM